MRNIYDIENKLLSLADEGYKNFQSALMPTVLKEKIIGIRTPILRKYAKDLTEQEAKLFLSDLPHAYYEENNLHAFLIERIGDFDDTVKALDAFLPYVDNWATCDSMNPKIFSKFKERILPIIDQYISSGHTYTIRFGIGLLMRHFLGDSFKKEYAERVCAVKSEEYYVKMMQAWYFATALAYNFDEVLPFLEENRLSWWVHNKTITKATESFRIKNDIKEYLKKLKKD